MTDTLQSLIDALRADPGLRANIPQRDIDRGVAGAEQMNAVLLRVIATLGANSDGLITEAEMVAVSDAVYNTPNDFVPFLRGHGNDNGEVESGYHYLQDDGATLEFQGRNFADTVADAIYHYGFETHDGRYVNEDGNSNETVADVAGWLNYFLNGRNTVLGSDENDDLGSGNYSEYFAAARNETFRAGAGQDRVWAGVGDDTILAGSGQDEASGDEGRDRISGEAGDDALYGGAGGDTLWGGGGRDELAGGDGADVIWGEENGDTAWGGTGEDRIDGGRGNDLLYGEAEGDRVFGAQGNDEIGGGDGADVLFGGDGADAIVGGEGRDVLTGGRGADTFNLWESQGVADTLVFAPGDSGRSRATLDTVEGFTAGQDRIDLRAFGPMVFAELDFRGGGTASCYYDGTHLRIDADGDRAADMIVAFAWVDALSAGDFLFA